MNRNLTSLVLIVLAVGIYLTVTSKIIDSAKQVSEVNKQYIESIKSADNLIKMRDKIKDDYNSIAQEDRDKLSKLLPRGVDNIRLIIDLNNFAMQHGYVFKNIKVSSPNSSTASTKTKNSVPEAPVPVMNSVPVPFMPSSVTKPVSIGSAASVDAITISFDVSSTYQEFVSLLEELEANLRLMDITNLTITAGDTGVYNYHIELKTYWLRSQ